MATNKPDFESTYGAPFTAVHRQFRSKIPLKQVRHPQEPTVVAQPCPSGTCRWDGRETSYFEWLGAGIYSTDLRSSIHTVRPHFLHELYFGFGERFFYSCAWTHSRKCCPSCGPGEFRIALRGKELRLMAVIEQGNFAGCLLIPEDVCRHSGSARACRSGAFDGILEVGIGRRLIALMGRTSFTLEVALWQGGLPVDVLPRASSLEIRVLYLRLARPAQ